MSDEPTRSRHNVEGAQIMVAVDGSTGRIAEIAKGPSVEVISLATNHTGPRRL